MYCAPKGILSQLYYPELDMSFLLKINKLEKIAAQLCEKIKDNDRKIFIRNYTLNELWTEYCEKQEICNPEYHANKKRILGFNIQQVRLSCGFTIQEIAAMLNFSDAQIVEWENGTQLPNISEINALSKFLKHPFDTYIKNSYYA